MEKSIAAKCLRLLIFELIFQIKSPVTGALRFNLRLKIDLMSFQGIA